MTRLSPSLETAIERARQADILSLAERLGAEQLPTPLKFVGEELPTPTHAPTVGQHTEAVLRDVLGWDDDRIAESRARGGLGGEG